MNKLPVNTQDIEKLATLARLSISREALHQTTQNIADVLTLVNELQAVDTEGIQPLAHPLDAEQSLRPDCVSETDLREAFQAIAPATQDGLYLVPRVIG